MKIQQKMSTNRKESQHLYNYLCWKIGSEKEVKARRLSFIALDTYSKFQISSGSRSEGLDLKGSDIDLMIHDSIFKVYETESEVVKGKKIVFLMDTTDTQPCFTRLRLHTNYNKLDKIVKQMTEQHEMKFLLSNKHYKQIYLKHLNSAWSAVNKIHGPCLSDSNDDYDLAFCLKCDKWISQAVPWINRPRSSWLSPEIISKIAMSGVLFVPIGMKGSRYENLEWRISFSLAEKVLIFSFNHTQLLCYALLKIVMKEIIEKDEDLKGLLCSYYLKTLMFWISDDLDPAKWRPNNITKCFLACLQRLIYSVEYSVLIHYFISDYNFFDLRLRAELEKKKKLTSMLKKLYKQGIQCFSASETLHAYSRFPTEISKQLSINSRLVHDVLQISCLYGFSHIERSIPKLLHLMLYHSKTELTNDIFNFYMSTAHRKIPQIPTVQQKNSNKQQYYKYKFDLSQLLMGLHSDAVIGWLMLASFFYVHEMYLTSLDIIKYAFLKLTDEKRRTPSFKREKIILTPKQQFALEMMKKEKLITTIKTLTVNNLLFAFKSQIIPKELQKDVIRDDTWFHPLTFAHFLRFLCFYHLHDSVSCEHAKHHLVLANKEMLFSGESLSLLRIQSTILVGIAAQMTGETDIAKMFFKLVATHDIDNSTSAALRLFELG